MNKERLCSMTFPSSRAKSVAVLILSRSTSIETELKPLEDSVLAYHDPYETVAVEDRELQ